MPSLIRNSLFAVLLFMCSASMLFANDASWQQLYISELKFPFDDPKTNFGYVELYNASNDTLNLSDYWLQSGPLLFNSTQSSQAQFDSAYKWNLKGSLLPKNTFVVSAISNNHTIDAWGNRNYPNGYFNDELNLKADMRIAPDGSGNSLFQYAAKLGLFYRGDTSSVVGIVKRDSALVDLFGDSRNLDTNEALPYYIAGVSIYNHGVSPVFFRKSSVYKGNPDFEVGRGTNAENSEWIVLEGNSMSKMYDKAFTTVGAHTNQAQLEFTAKREAIQINLEQHKINFPYGIRRDSLFRYFNFGPNHAWDFRLGPDTAQWYVSSDDTIIVHVLGASLQSFKFLAEVESVPSDFVKVRPRRYRLSNGIWNTKFTVSDGELPYDTIGNIPFKTSVDTLLKYLVVEETTVNEIIFQGGEHDFEVNNNDTLIVGRPDQQVKKYLLKVQPYAPSHNAFLETIYTHGIKLWENPSTFEATDTLMDFAAQTFRYKVVLPDTFLLAPALKIIPQSMNAHIVVHRPKNLFGSAKERTSIITVAAEDDTTIRMYEIEYELKNGGMPIPSNPSDDVGLDTKVGEEVSLENDTLKVPFAWTVDQLMAALILPENAQFLILDKQGQRVAVKRYNYSRECISYQEFIPTFLMRGFSLAIIAENRLDTAIYPIQLFADSAVFERGIVSNDFQVSEEFKTISSLRLRSVESFLYHIDVNPLFEVSVINKIRKERKVGMMDPDDLVLIQHGTQKVFYRIVFDGYERFTVGEPPFLWKPPCLFDSSNPISELKISRKLCVYPNPTSGEITIENISVGDIITIRNIAGKTVKVQSARSKVEQVRFDGLPGLYLLSIRSENNEVKIAKIMKR